METEPIRSSWMVQRARRAVLTREQARAIFVSKPSPSSSERCHVGKLSKAYGVSPKTVRDIWAGRTWYRETYLLDQTKPASTERLYRKRGRPMGAKDVKPRSKKSDVEKNQQLSSQIVRNVAALPVLTIFGENLRHDANGSPRLFDSNISTAIDWADYLYENSVRFSPFIDPFHGDWAFWPKDESDPC